MQRPVGYSQVVSALKDVPSTGRGRPRDPRLRTLVLTAASNQLASKGFSAMTMEGILAETGVAKRTLYRWWPSKSSVVAEAIVGGFIQVPDNKILHTADIWQDLTSWLQTVAIAIRGPYGEVLRAAAAISADDPALGESLSEAFAVPARANLIERLQSAANQGQISVQSNLGAVTDLLMAIITFVGITRDDVDRIGAALEVIRSGIAPR